MEKIQSSWDLLIERSRNRFEEYTQKQLEKAEQNRKNFIVFQKPETVPVIAFMESLPHKDEFTKNYLHFMKTLGKPMTASLTHCGLVEPGFPENVMGEILEDGLNAHYIAQICSLRNPTLRTFFGFIDRYNGNQYVRSRSHSFLVSECGNYIYDMREQFRFDCYETLGNLPELVRNYFGAEIPHAVLYEIYEQRPKGHYANDYAKFIRQEIFTSRDRTEAFIEKIQSALA